MQQPTLVLPPAVVIPPPGSALLGGHTTQMDALLHIKASMPDQAFREFLEGGLREARFWGGRDEATMDRRVEAAVAQHGSIGAAMRAGAI